MNTGYPFNGLTPLVELTRGEPPWVESGHAGALAVVDSSGNLLAAAGDPFLITYIRSSAKPFQALPTVASGALEHYGLDEQALAVMCASHHGTDEHVATVQRILDRIGLDQSALRCGVHWPIDEVTGRQLAAAGLEPTPLYNNCSGKHAGMLTLARFRGLSIDNYNEPAHPVQQAIGYRLAAMAGLAPDDLRQAPDGCTVPSFALPLANVALAFARLVDAGAPPECRRVVSAMQSYPHLVAGHDALDDMLMRAGAGAVVCKGGAEGYEGLGVRTPDDRAVGMALKIGDGNGRGKGVAIVAVLESLGLVDEATLARLEPLRRPARTNHRQQVVGEMRLAADFKLARFDPPLPMAGSGSSIR